MNTSEDVYRKLASHLDRLPNGFPPSRTGADLRLLARLFTPEEAGLAVHLTLDRESPAAIAARAGLAEAVAAERLAEMARKGLVFYSQGANGAIAYQALPWVVGIYEFQVNTMDQDLLKALFEYWSSLEPQPHPETIPQLRTIPIRESIEHRVEAMTYEQLNELQEERQNMLPVVHNGELVGVITLENIGEFMMIQSAVRARKMASA